MCIRDRIEAAAEDEGSGIGALTGADIEQQLLPIRAWASVLDRDTYRAERTDNGLRIESEPPAEIVEAMRPDTEELERSQASMPVSYTHLRAHETVLDLVCRLLLEKNTPPPTPPCVHPDNV